MECKCFTSSQNTPKSLQFSSQTQTFTVLDFNLKAIFFPAEIWTVSVFSYFLLFLTVLPLSLGKEDTSCNESFLWRLCSSTV